MMLVEETTVPSSALPVTQFKEHLRLGTGFADDDVQDALIESYLRAAMAAIEARIGKILIERDFSWTLTAWRNSTCQVLPVSPVSAITEIVQIDRSGVETPVAGTGWRLIADPQRSRIEALGGQLPGVPSYGSVKIGFMAGYGPDWDDLPADIAQAVMILAAHYHEFRHEAGMRGGGMPYSVNALLERHKSVRLGGM